jgi:hypothetical protein
MRCSSASLRGIGGQSVWVSRFDFKAFLLNDGMITLALSTNDKISADSFDIIYQNEARINTGTVPDIMANDLWQIAQVGLILRLVER